jgi:SAM-dependent methyltransferase
VSGFSADWLALRETADRRARSRPVLAAVARWAERQPRHRPLRVVDLGAGTGSTLRALSRHLHRPQTWTLVDHDRTLLAIAERQAPGEQSHRIRVRTTAADLADPDVVADALGSADLTTASALFDLVAETWCRHMVQAVARRGGALYAALTYDGRMALLPDDGFDATIRCLVNRHQRTDKGCGPAHGPAAPRMLARLARAASGRVRTGTSDWHLGPFDRPMMALLLDGWAQAAREMAPLSAGDIDAWLVRRHGALDRDGLRAIVGHVDLLATW